MDKKKWIRAVDIGGDGVRTADVCGQEVVNLRTRGAISNVDELLSFVAEDLPKNTIGISYATAGDINNHDLVTKSPNAHFLDGIYLAHITTQKTKIASYVCNDMEAAVVGMHVLLPEFSYFMGITWSSGIGECLFQNGVIIANSEGGHIPLDPSPFAPLCGCGGRGCAESILGGKSICRRVINETKALGISISDDVDPCETLDLAYDKEEEWAVSIYDLIVKGMGSFLATHMLIARLPAIVWKGTFAENALPRIEKQIRKEMAERLAIKPDLASEEKVKFIFSPKPKEDGLIGAASILLKSLE